MIHWDNPSVIELIRAALSEDLYYGDITSDLIIPQSSESIGYLSAKESFCLAGQAISARVFKEIDPLLIYKQLVSDGTMVDKSQVIASVQGRITSILAGERTALNFLQRLSGIATAAHKAMAIVKDTDCRIIDTRKTLPGWRVLDKYAVRVGGAFNHRMSLGDGILIKDNHIKAVGSVKMAVQKALADRRHHLKVQVEVTSMEEAEEAVNAGTDALLLDNMQPEDIYLIAARYRDKVVIETSGNINFENLHRYAVTGVHLISMGQLTHSVAACDISLNLE